jgi:hypothetical protein
MAFAFDRGWFNNSTQPVWGLSAGSEAPPLLCRRPVLAFGGFSESRADRHAFVAAGI